MSRDHVTSKILAAKAPKKSYIYIKHPEIIGKNVCVSMETVRLTLTNPPSCFQGGNGEGNDRTPGSVGNAVVAVTMVTDQTLIRSRSDQSLWLRAVAMATA